MFIVVTETQTMWTRVLSIDTSRPGPQDTSDEYPGHSGECGLWEEEDAYLEEFPITE